ncbi:MAG: hypothetical protein IKI20_04510 [Lachnospiraceae bacterium]|nr:hypothetical protein [Lachnospiraceae bacterium]
MSKENGQQNTTPKAKRILAWIGIVLVTLWFGATIFIALFPFENKARLFPIFIIGCVVIPIVLWIVIWLVGIVTGKRTIASFRNEETEEMLKKADEIKMGIVTGAIKDNENEVLGEDRK